jgi:hypothetical protein
MLAKLQARGSKYDLIQPSDYVIEEMIKDGRLEELDLAAIPNVKNLDPKFRSGRNSVSRGAGGQRVRYLLLSPRSTPRPQTPHSTRNRSFARSCVPKLELGNEGRRAERGTRTPARLRITRTR